MNETRQVEQRKKKPFEIFTPDEIKDLKFYSQGSSGIQDLFNKLTLTMNEGIHNKNVGWHTRMISLIDAEDNPYSSPLEEHHKVELKKSLDRYLETANRLQKEKNGSLESLTLPTAQQTIEKHVNVYKNFWDNCVEELFLAFLVNISAKSEQELQDGTGKLYLYCLFKLQQSTLGKLNLEEDRTARIQACLTKVTRHIMVLCKLQPPFLLTKNELQEAHVIRKNLFKKYQTLVDLRREYESRSSCSTYIHLRSEIVIEFAQLIDYVIKKIEKELIADKKLKKNIQPIMEVLENKRKELAITMVLQEKLYLSFGTDDYIETLSKVISNQRSKSLPQRILFGYLDSQLMQVAYYPPDDVSAPKLIEKLYHSRWRHKYIKLYANEFYNDLKNEIGTQPQEEKLIDVSSNLFIQTNLVALIESDKATDLRLPEFIVSCLLSRRNDSFAHKHEEVKKPESIISYFLGKRVKLPKDEVNHSYDNLFDFFVTRKNERENFYRLSQYHEAIEFLMRQVDHKMELYAFFKIPRSTICSQQNEFTQTTINNFSAMKNLILGFEKEIMQTNALLNTSPHMKIPIQRYIDLVKTSRDNIIREADRILTYWDDRLKESKSWHFKESGQYDKFKLLIDSLNAVLPKKSVAKTNAGEFRVN